MTCGSLPHAAGEDAQSERKRGLVISQVIHNEQDGGDGQKIHGTLRAAYPEQSEDEQQIHCCLRLADLREAIERIEGRVEARHPFDVVHKSVVCWLQHVRQPQRKSLVVVCETSELSRS